MSWALINVAEKMVKRSVQIAPALLLAVSVSSAHAAGGGGGAFMSSPLIDTGNKKSLQRGAQTFVNYCMGCHTADYHRYSRLAADLGLSEADVLDNLIFTTDKSGERSKVGSLMANTMSTDYAKQSFGVEPPNLALTARSRGVDWIYSYMKSFYADPDRGGVGVNNLVYPGAAMPHVLWEQQGWQKPIFKDDGTFDHFEQVTEGTMTPEEYDGMISDLTAFMAYLADPIKQVRHKVGMFVMLFLLLLTVIAYFLKKEYWKDVV